MSLMTLILILRTLLEFHQGVGLSWKEMSQGFDYNFKVEIPEFHGRFKPEDFVDWLNTIERVFDYYEVMDEKKVKLVAIRLKGRASAWWEQLQISHAKKW